MDASAIIGQHALGDSGPERAGARIARLTRTMTNKPEAPEQRMHAPTSHVGCAHPTTRVNQDNPLSE